jgi:hypothetical protein
MEKSRAMHQRRVLVAIAVVIEIRILGVKAFIMTNYAISKPPQPRGQGQ